VTTLARNFRAFNSQARRAVQLASDTGRRARTHLRLLASIFAFGLLRSPTIHRRRCKRNPAVISFNVFARFGCSKFSFSRLHNAIRSVTRRRRIRVPIANARGSPLPSFVYPVRCTDIPSIGSRARSPLVLLFSSPLATHKPPMCIVVIWGRISVYRDGLHECWSDTDGAWLNFPHFIARGTGRTIGKRSRTRGLKHLFFFLFHSSPSNVIVRHATGEFIAACKTLVTNETLFAGTHPRGRKLRRRRVVSPPPAF